MLGRMLIVGAGFAGAVTGRILAENGVPCTIIDRRDHIGGNAYDEVIGGVRVHRYGPHLFHTNNEQVFQFLSRFTDWIEYRHQVAALVDGCLLPLPINLTTLEHFAGTEMSSEADARSYLSNVQQHIDHPRNAAEQLASTIGIELMNVLFRPYSEKMWGMPLEQLDSSVTNRIGLRFNRCAEYFSNQRYQFLPKNGYTALFQKMLQHDLIDLKLGTDFHNDMEYDYKRIFNSMAIDEYYNYEFGALPYRSIRFHYGSPRVDTTYAVVNYTDSSPYTRENHWHNLCGHQVAQRATAWTIEEPCCYSQNNYERYYPVKDVNGEHECLFKRYKNLSRLNSKMIFIGRCGTYQYLDMDQVVNQQIQNMTRMGYKVLF